MDRRKLRKSNKISLVLPVLNEARTLPAVLEMVSHSDLDEIIVSDNGSTDNSIKIAMKFAQKDNRIKVTMWSGEQGSGAARRNGIKHAKGNVLVFLDADIGGSLKKVPEKLYTPILGGKFDMVMASFNNEGRITELMAKPLLSIFFPKLAGLKQPLSGLFAIKHEFVFPEKIDDGNAMIGILLDAYNHGARIGEVEIGQLEHCSRDMSMKRQRAEQTGRYFMKRLFEFNKLDKGLKLMN